MTAAGRLRGELAGTALRWGACFLLVLGLHAGLAVALLRRVPRPALPVSAPEIVMLELAPDAVPQPDTPPVPDPRPDLEPKPPDAPPPPEPAPPEPPPDAPFPVEPVPPELPPPIPTPPVPSLPPPAVALPEPSPMPKRPPPPPRPARPPRPAPPWPPPDPTPNAAPVPAPPPAAPAASSSSALPGWRSELAGRLQRAKRYPGVARAREEQGAAAVTFTLDRSGHVLSVKLVRSSGSPSLDEEAVALVRRADPLPPMPADMAGNTVTLTQSVTFSLR